MHYVAHVRERKFQNLDLKLMKNYLLSTTTDSTPAGTFIVVLAVDCHSVMAMNHIDLVKRCGARSQPQCSHT